MAVAVPVLPFTVGGGVALPLELLPQHTTAWVPAWMAQPNKLPLAIALAVPAVPFTEAGGNPAGPVLPQQITAPFSAWTAQARADDKLAEIALARLPKPHPTTGPDAEAEPESSRMESASSSRSKVREPPSGSPNALEWRACKAVRGASVHPAPRPRDLSP
jgi:hypothetical protein